MDSGTLSVIHVTCSQIDSDMGGGKKKVLKIMFVFFWVFLKILFIDRHILSKQPLFASKVMHDDRMFFSRFILFSYFCQET